VAEEVGHVGAARRWFGFLARRRGLDPVLYGRASLYHINNEIMWTNQ